MELDVEAGIGSQKKREVHSPFASAAGRRSISLNSVSAAVSCYDILGCWRAEVTGGKTKSVVVYR